MNSMRNADDFYSEIIEKDSNKYYLQKIESISKEFLVIVINNLNLIR